MRLSTLEKESPYQNVFDESRNEPVEHEEHEELEEREAVEEELPPLPPLSVPPGCQEMLKKTSVAIVGGGLAGLMAARQLRRCGIKVTVFEARSQVGGRVRSNMQWSKDRIIEEGAELIGSFHTYWLALAREYGLSMISRMDGDLYEREGLEVKLKLDKDLTMREICDLDRKMEEVLWQIAKEATQIHDPFKPWNQPGLKKYDNMTVADALVQYRDRRNERLWKYIEFKLVNDEVAPLEEMNYLGLLCKVRAGQVGHFCNEEEAGPEECSLPKECVLKLPKHCHEKKECPEKERLMRYWNELEIFRCADGCQTLAKEMANEIQKDYGNIRSRILLKRAVTSIQFSNKSISITSTDVLNEDTGRTSGKKYTSSGFNYAILAAPPSVWDGITIKENNSITTLARMGMNPAVKYFSDVKWRFWIKKKAAPSGGSLKIGQVWEGTDNQTRIPDPKKGPSHSRQGTVLNVFAGPIITETSSTGKAIRRAPNESEIKGGLKELYPDYISNLTKKPLYSNWPGKPFIMTGYASPRKGEVFTLGKFYSKPWNGWLFFAGEHTQMDFFGYMEGALRSGDRVARELVQQICNQQTVSARSAPTRAKKASEHEIGSMAYRPGEDLSPSSERDISPAWTEEWEEPEEIEVKSGFNEEILDELEEERIAVQTGLAEDESLRYEGIQLAEEEDFEKELADEYYQDRGGEEAEAKDSHLLQFDTPIQTRHKVGWHNAMPQGASDITIPPSPAGWNQGKWIVSGMVRIPLEGLKLGYQIIDKQPGWTNEAANGKAVVLIPPGSDETKLLEVLMYFHGDGPGYRQANSDFCILPGQGCLKKGFVEDVEIARIAPQLQASKRQIIAVLPQCPHGKSRGGWNSNCDKYLSEVFDRLVLMGIWREKPSIHRVILAGHSRGGDTIFSMIASRNKLLPSSLEGLVLFDGIHSAGYQSWALRGLEDDLKRIKGLSSSADRLDYLKESLKFRAYHAGASYTSRHTALDKAIKDWFIKNQKMQPGISTTVWDALKANYQVIAAGHGDHFFVGKPMNNISKEPPLLNALKELPVTSSTGVSRSSTPPSSKLLGFESGDDFKESESDLSIALTPEGEETSESYASESIWETGQLSEEAASPFLDGYGQDESDIRSPETEETEHYGVETYFEAEGDVASGGYEGWNDNAPDEMEIEYDIPAEGSVPASLNSTASLFSSYRNKVFIIENAHARLRNEDFSTKKYTASDTIPSGKKIGDPVSLPAGMRVKISRVKTDASNRVFALVYDAVRGSAALPLGWTSSENFRGKLYNETLGLEAASYIVEPAVRADFFTVGNHEALVRKGGPGYNLDKGKGKLTQGSFVAVGDESKDSNPKGKYVKVKSLKKSGDGFVLDKELGWTAKSNLVAGLANFKGTNAAWQSAGKGKPGDYIGQIDLLSIVARKGKMERISRDVYAAYIQMVKAAAAEGIEIILEDGFRSYPDQERLYRLYKKGKGNLAAPPGGSNHQNGIALDLVVQHTANKGVGTGSVYNWLKKNATSYGFVRTVPTEAWHWEYRPSLAARLRAQRDYKSWNAPKEENEDPGDGYNSENPEEDLDFADRLDVDAEINLEDLEYIDQEQIEE